MLHAATVNDATGRAVHINDPSRIVSIGGAITEILYALGARQRDRRVDTTSLYPPQALEEEAQCRLHAPALAGRRAGLNPSLILAVEGSGPKETIAVLNRPPRFRS